MQALTADALELAILNSTQDFRLGERAHVGNFVEEKCARVSHLKLSSKHMHGSGERAALVTEKLTFKQCVTHCGCIEGKKRFIRSQPKNCE